MRRINLLKYCELPLATEKLNFENFRVGNEKTLKEAYQCSLGVVAGKLKWLVLAGHSDLGKTHLLVAICREWLKSGRPAKYAYVPLLLDELRQGYKPGTDIDYDTRFNLFCDVPLLALDDLGTENSTLWVQEKLDTLIDYRYFRELPLVVTTNKRMDEISPRIRSRLQRIDMGKIVIINAPEYRTVKGSHE
jgi:DNA replication protein DnaC